MTDKVIEAIRNNEISAENLTPNYLRNYYCRDVYNDGRLALDRGRGVFNDTDQLDQYLYTYGKMVNQQWSRPFSFSMIDSSTTLIDYGCGQGLSFLNLTCNWAPDDPNQSWQDLIKSIVLIEPSKVALKRAEAIARFKFPDASVNVVNKKLEELSPSDISYDDNEIYMHIFSQVLDIPFNEDFDFLDFFESITSSKGIHYILVVSHDIKQVNSSQLILKLYKYIAKKYVHDGLSLDDIKVLLNGTKDVVCKNTTNLALNSFKTEDGYDSISMFACIKTS